jgi:hypothetical protein
VTVLVRERSAQELVANRRGGHLKKENKMTRNGKFLVLLVVGLLACGAFAVGCGDDDDSTSTAATPTDTSTTSDDSGDDTSTTSDDSGDSSTPDDVYNACLDVIKGTPAEAAGETACAQARDAFEQCASQADSIDDAGAHDTAVAACQDAADQAVAALQAAG